MEIVLHNHGVYIKHLEFLAHTDSQVLKQAEIVGKPKKWKNAKFPIHLAIYLDMLTPLKVLSLGFQTKMHDSVVAIWRISEFNWTNAKLQMLIDSSIEGGNGGRLTHLTKLFKKTKQADEGHLYQDINL